MLETWLCPPPPTLTSLQVGQCLDRVRCELQCRRLPSGLRRRSVVARDGPHRAGSARPRYARGVDGSRMPNDLIDEFYTHI
jgi:hypothetical protein